MEHNFEFTTQAAYEGHRKTTHQKGVALPQGIPETALPDEEFVKQVERIEKAVKENDGKIIEAHAIIPEEFEEVTVATPAGNITRKLPKTVTGKGKESGSTSVQMPLEPTEQKEAVLPYLTYVWKGQCPSHKAELTTIQVDGDFTAVVAYCLAGNHQVQSQRVIPVKEQTFTKRKEVKHGRSE